MTVNGLGGKSSQSTGQDAARRRQSLLPRWMHCVYAAVLGYFWLPCPICGRNFGGHEWKEAGHTLWGPFTGTGRKGTGTCRACPVDDPAVRYVA